VSGGPVRGPVQATTLYLLRHAHAGDPEAWSGPDELRPLSEKGKRQAKRLGRFLADGPARPDAIVTSPKVRAEQTARAVAKALDVPVRLDQRLAGGFGMRSLVELVGSLDAGAPMLVGHDPDFSALLAGLIGARGVEMRKGALAAIDLSWPLERGAGTLRFLISPELLEKR
jgi:phosphohistidine phosphatase SixA